VKNIADISKEWNLSIEERRTLYKSASKVLDEFNDA
jgi:hypothetical protein